MRRTSGGALMLAAAILAAGCASPRDRARELQRVARDWALTIRAAQVLPVYPLTADLQPGDVFLVSTPVEAQAAAYEERGFLPMDHLLVRLQPLDFRTFYSTAYPDAAARPGPDRLSLAPRAAFPAYTFAVRRGLGLQAALPLQGIPLGLGFLQSASASGTISITDALTYGLDDRSLRGALEVWAGAHRDYLRNFAPSRGKRRYLRVVSRVYLAGAVNVTLADDAAAESNAAAGASGPPGEDPAGACAERLAALQKGLDALPGGNLRIAAATTRSVSLNERFEVPLAVGYLAFDVPILTGGRLGLPVPTGALLGGATAPSGAPFDWAPPSPRAACIRAWLDETAEQDPNPRRTLLAEWLTARGIRDSVTRWLHLSAAPGRESEFAEFIRAQNIPCP
jgi:hypothetical protein